MSQEFEFDADDLTTQEIEWGTPGLTVQIDQVGLMTQLVPASAIGLFSDTIITGHDKSWQITAFQADNVTPFNLTGIMINFYAKVNPSDTTLVFSKSLTNNPNDISVPVGTDGNIIVFVRASDYATLAVGTSLFLYVDVIDNAGTPVNIQKWVLTITN